ncbi:hypothetical protein MN116_005043 [Schistosoma mekongi]|uniref:Uncharacterized protein n=1 Tax=Schistosoma mekongi TaxID=38744 RepID=A0AAE1ZD11_SCHME|nr:hypothetical protein MN116_005042 [Schistosoma mekongi]KAK4471633.1 hypothetical protein MN116_005043 [Schistosoma mekongi]
MFNITFHFIADHAKTLHADETEKDYKSHHKHPKSGIMNKLVYQPIHLHSLSYCIVSQICNLCICFMYIFRSNYFINELLIIDAQYLSILYRKGEGESVDRTARRSK